MIDFNDFDSKNFQENIKNDSNPQSSFPNLDFGGGSDSMNNMFMNQNQKNQQEDEEEQKRISERQKEAEERKEKINKKIEQEEKMRNDIRKKALEFLAEFEAKRQELIAKKRKELEEKELNRNKDNNPQGNSEMWSKVSGNIDLKESDYKGSKDVQRMREAMMNRQNDPNSEPLKNFFG